MKISIIVAFDENRLIGRDNGLPWHLPADLKHFKQITMGHHMIMGRKTFESIGKALPGRTSIVISRQKNYVAEGCLMADSLQNAISLCEGQEEVFIIGGAQIFESALSAATNLYVTIIHHKFEGETHFPEIKQSEWIELSREGIEPDEKNEWAYTFINYSRK